MILRTMKSRFGFNYKSRQKTYSVESKLIGETIFAHLFSNRVEVWYGDKVKKLVEADSPEDDFMETKVSKPNLSDYDNL